VRDRARRLLRFGSWMIRYPTVARRFGGTRPTLACLEQLQHGRRPISIADAETALIGKRARRPPFCCISSLGKR